MITLKKRPPTSWINRRFPLFLATLTIVMLVVIELQQPYFFLKRDNLDQNLPYYIHNIRSLLAGEFPLFNFHQFLGTPVFSCIQSAALYPPNYVALCLSKLLFGNYYGTMEIVAAFHLMLAATGFFRLMRYFDLSEWSCSFGAIAWVFCGTTMIVGSEWIQVVGYAAYFPWILLFSLRLLDKFEFRSFAILTLLRLMALYLGSPPYFIYMVTFDFLTTTALHLVIVPRSRDTRGPAKTVFIQIASYLCTAIIAAPLLLPALNQIRLSAGRNNPLSWEEYSKAGSHWLNWLGGLFNQFHNTNSKWSHIGLLTIFFCIAAIWQRKNNKKICVVFLLLATLSLLWASNTFITELFYYVPIFNRQRFPIKLLFFTNFYLIALATLGFDVLYLRFSRLGLHRTVTASVIIIIFIIHLGNFYIFNISPPQIKGKTVPYDEPLTQILKDGRIVTVIDSPARNDDDKQMYLLGFNYATLFDLYHFAGYETLLSAKNQKASMGLNSSADMYLEQDVFSPSMEDLQYFRNWGVKWYVLDKAISVDSSGILKLFYSDEKRSILYDSNAKPFVFWADNLNMDEVVHTFTAKSVKVTTARENAGLLLVNVLYNPFFSATIDGKDANISESKEQQILVEVPGGNHEVKITYSDPYFKTGIFITSGFFMFAAVYMSRRHLKNRLSKWAK